MEVVTVVAAEASLLAVAVVVHEEDSATAVAVVEAVEEVVAPLAVVVELLAVEAVVDGEVPVVERTYKSCLRLLEHKLIVSTVRSSLSPIVTPVSSLLAERRIFWSPRT